MVEGIWDIYREDIAVVPPDLIVTDGWFSLHFSIFAEFGVRPWVAEMSCPSASQPLWPAVLTPSKVVQIFGTFKGGSGCCSSGSHLGASGNV